MKYFLMHRESQTDNEPSVFGFNSIEAARKSATDDFDLGDIFNIFSLDANGTMKSIEQATTFSVDWKKV